MLANARYRAINAAMMLSWRRVYFNERLYCRISLSCPHKKRRIKFTLVIIMLRKNAFPKKVSDVQKAIMNAIREAKKRKALFMSCVVCSASKNASVRPPTCAPT